MKIEAAVNREFSHGKRDYSALLLATRHGIRYDDIARLTFDELNFQKNIIIFCQHKTSVTIELPTIPDVKATREQYIQEESGSSDNAYVSYLLPSYGLSWLPDGIFLFVNEKKHYKMVIEFYGPPGRIQRCQKESS